MFYCKFSAGSVLVKGSVKPVVVKDIGCCMTHTVFKSLTL